MSGFKIGRVTVPGKLVRRRLNGHIVKVWEPTRTISHEEANRRARELVEKWEKEEKSKRRSR